MEQARALLVLVRAGLPAALLRGLLETHRTPAAVLAAGVPAWRDAGVAASVRAALRRPDAARLRADLAWLAAGPRHLLGWHDADFPALLRAVPDPPPALFVEGEPACLWHPQVAIVGSRRASPGGIDTARAFARGFGLAGLAVTSGLAAGIDTAAHRGALDAGTPTIAVVATGLDIVFPRANTALAARIAGTGAVVSEYPPGTDARAGQFPARNRLIAGLSLGTLVVEAAERSGALITARLAGESGREVFAVPGSIQNPMARGCHRLIRQGVALVETPDEVMAALGPVAASLGNALRRRLGVARPPSRAFATAANDGEPADKRVLVALGFEAVNLDQLAGRTGLTVATLAPMLLAMELDGRVIAENGRYVRRT